MKTFSRREFLRAGTAGLVASAFPSFAINGAAAPMYGLIGKIKVVAGQRATVVEALLDGVNDMPGCLSYVVAEDPSDPDAIWVTEVWDSKESHAGSLELPAVQAAIKRAKPYIAGFGEHFETAPVGGRGLVGMR